jgi:osmotically-inducible protein OsmY
MSWLGFYAAKGFSDLVSSELEPSAQRGEPYLLPDERARQAACARLGAEADLDASRVEVRVLSGVLRLSGIVPDEVTRTRAEQLCQGLAGVASVENELTVE